MFSVLLPSISFGAGMEVTGWIPYWESRKGPESARENLEDLTEIHPFAFVVQPNGKVKDLAGLRKSAWRKLFKEARKEGLEIIPTVMWSDTERIHEILSDEDDRGDLVDEIVKIVRKGKYDGIDVDFEAKKASTRGHYSAFLTELKDELDDKTLVCTTEARTPPESLYSVVPRNIEYANDYNVIARVCDRVNIMTYDQQRADLKLNELRSGAPYFPLADPLWVEKVINLTIQTIPPEKIRLGVGTYGRENMVTVMPNWFQGYTRIRAINEPDGLKIAEDFDITPRRNEAGELELTYISDSSTRNLLSKTRAPRSTDEALEAAMRALSYSNSTGQTVFVNHVSWSDAEAIEDKIELAKRYGLAGIAIFKIDGHEDPDLWEVVNGLKD